MKSPGGGEGGAVMCYVDLEPCEVWEERHRKARRQHRCSCCRRAIQPGEQYLVHFSVFEGNAETQKCCAECERDRQTFADAHGGTLCQPSFLPEMLGNCIGDEPESEADWRPMLDRIRAVQAAAEA
jgi:hypothetical protein